MGAGLLYWLVLPNGIPVEVLPEGASVTTPPLPVRHETEVQTRSRPAHRQCEKHTDTPSRRAYSSIIGVCARLEVFADRLSRYSNITSGLPSTIMDCPSTWRYTMSPSTSPVNPRFRSKARSCSPSCRLRSRYPTHCLDRGMLNMLPTMGRRFGLGGRGRPRVRARQCPIDQR